MAIILNLLMVSEQSTVVNKVNVLMPDLWLRVDREQKNTKLTLFFFSVSFPVIFDDECNSLEVH